MQEFLEVLLQLIKNEWNGSLLFYWVHKQLESTPFSRNVQKWLPLPPCPPQRDGATPHVTRQRYRDDTWYMVITLQLTVLIHWTSSLQTMVIQIYYIQQQWDYNNYYFTQIFLLLDSDQHNLFSHNKALKLDKCLLKMFADNPNTTNNQNVICCCKTTFLISFEISHLLWVWRFFEVSTTQFYLNT